MPQKTTFHFKPLHDRILIKRLEAANTAAGGIIIPDVAKERPLQGHIVAIGDGKMLADGRRVAPDVKVGDRVLFAKFGGSEISVDGQLFTVLREDEILGVVEV